MSRGVEFNLVALFAHGDDLVELGEDEIAFGLLGCGADILLANTYADEFPAEARIAKKGAKLLTKALGGAESIAACSLLSQSQAALASERQRRHGTEEDAVVHAAGADLVQRHYALPRNVVADLERQRIEAWEWADELRAREERGWKSRGTGRSGWPRNASSSG